MNKLYCLIILFVACKICNAQNLIPNGDFEQYSSCPTSINELTKAVFWINPVPNGTPDYHNQCGGALAGVPSNFFGNQAAHSGAGYGGLMHYFSSYPHYREYAEVQLTSTLQANQCYYFEMYVSLSENSQFSTGDLSAYFSDTLIDNIPFWTNLTFIPQVVNTNGIIADTANWILVSGNFQATGGENYLLIGNFLSDSTITLSNNPFGTLPQAYYYIDDVSLTPCTGIEEQNKSAEIKIYPNPFLEKISITNVNNELSEIIIWNIFSEKLLQQSFINSVTINTKQFAKGIYLYEVRNKNGVIKKGKVVKE